MRKSWNLLIIIRNATEGSSIWQPFTNLCLAQGMRVLAVGRISKKLGNEDTAAVLVVETNLLKTLMFRPKIERLVSKNDYILVPFVEGHLFCFFWEQYTTDFRTQPLIEAESELVS